MGAAILVLGLGGLLAFSARARPKKKKLPPAVPPPEPPNEPPVVVWEMEEWFIPEGWLEDTATPAVQEVVFSLHEEGQEIDPIEVTYEILKDQLGGFNLPPTPHPPEGEFWQTDVPNASSYYVGPESVLGLYYHVNAYVEDALGRWAAGDDLYLFDLGMYDDEDEEAA